MDGMFFRTTEYGSLLISVIILIALLLGQKMNFSADCHA